MADCKTCSGTGCVYHALTVTAPGGIGRRRIRVERLCDCVRVAQVYAEIEDRVSIGAPIANGEEGRT